MVRSVPPSLVGSGRSNFGIGTQEATTWCIEKGISSPRHDPLRRGVQGMCRVLVAIDGKPRRLLFQLFEIDDRRIILVTIVSIKPHSDGKYGISLKADEIRAGDCPHIYDLSGSWANAHEWDS
jgi:hypothetical protein